MVLSCSASCFSKYPMNIIDFNFNEDDDYFYCYTMDCTGEYHIQANIMDNVREHHNVILKLILFIAL